MLEVVVSIIIIDTIEAPMEKFSHIFTIQNKKLQVRIGKLSKVIDNDETHGELGELKSALAYRNELFKSGHLPANVLVNTAKDKFTYSSSDYHHRISIRKPSDHNVSHLTVKISSFATKQRAIKALTEKYNLWAMQYNVIVNEYNKRSLNRFLLEAELELTSLLPSINSLKFDKNLWADCFNEIHSTTTQPAHSSLIDVSSVFTFLMPNFMSTSIGIPQEQMIGQNTDSYEVSPKSVIVDKAKLPDMFKSIAGTFEGQFRFVPFVINTNRDSDDYLTLTVPETIHGLPLNPSNHKIKMDSINAINQAFRFISYCNSIYTGYRLFSKAAKEGRLEWDAFDFIKLSHNSNFDFRAKELFISRINNNIISKPKAAYKKLCESSYYECGQTYRRYNLPNLTFIRPSQNSLSESEGIQYAVTNTILLLWVMKLDPAFFNGEFEYKKTSKRPRSYNNFQKIEFADSHSYYLDTSISYLYEKEISRLAELKDRLFNNRQKYHPLIRKNTTAFADTLEQNCLTYCDCCQLPAKIELNKFELDNDKSCMKQVTISCENKCDPVVVESTSWVDIYNALLTWTKRNNKRFSTPTSLTFGLRSAHKKFGIAAHKVKAFMIEKYLLELNEHNQILSYLYESEVMPFALPNETSHGIDNVKLEWITMICDKLRKLPQYRDFSEFEIKREIDKMTMPPLNDFTPYYSAKLTVGNGRMSVTYKPAIKSFSA